MPGVITENYSPDTKNRNSILCLCAQMLFLFLHQKLKCGNFTYRK